MNFDVSTDGILIPSEHQEVDTVTNAISSSVPQEIVIHTNDSINLNDGESFRFDIQEPCSSTSLQRKLEDIVSTNSDNKRQSEDLPTPFKKLRTPFKDAFYFPKKVEPT